MCVHASFRPFLTQSYLSIFTKLLTFVEDTQKIIVNIQFCTKVSLGTLNVFLFVKTGMRMKHKNSKTIIKVEAFIYDHTISIVSI